MSGRRQPQLFVNADKTEAKNWWAPVWRGLVVDPSGKHIRAMDGALPLFLYLVLHADRKTGVFRQRQTTIAQAMGMPVRTVRAWMERLRRHGYVAVKRTGRTAVSVIRKWKALTGDRPIPAALSGRIMPVRPAGSCQSVPEHQRKPEAGSGEISVDAIPNKSTSTRILLRHTYATGGTEGKRRWATAVDGRTALLAADLATGLGDEAHINRYRQYAADFPEDLLRRCLSETRAVPDRSIKRSRAALFQYLINHYGKPTSENPRR